ncbi:MAG: AAA family ATPase [Acidobacteriota bacterium]
MREELFSSPLWSFPFCPTPPSWKLDWEAIESCFDWIRSMRDCQQDPHYHGEGDVLTHTRMVCEALIELPQWRQLSPTIRSILFAAALLHDVAKPAYTYTDIEGRTSSRGHVRNGARMARQILWQMPVTNNTVPFHYREMIVALVRYSALPFFLFEKPDAQRAVILASQIVRCDWLALLEEADALGRKCEDKQELLDKIELFREFCKENRCFDGPRQFASPHSRFIYFRKDDCDPDYLAFDDTCFEVVLMSGLPGAGKDSWIKSHLQGWPTISLDDIRIEMEIPAHKNQGAVASVAKQRARQYLRTADAFVWNATNITRTMRKQLIDLFTAYKARVRIVYLECPFAQLFTRNRARANPVPVSVINRLISKLDIPDITEAHEIEWQAI